MSDQLMFELVAPEGLKFSGRTFEVILPTPEGQIAVLPHHIPLVSIVSPGVISIRHHQEDPDERLEHLACAGGVVTISGKRVRVLTDSAERAEDINELRAQEALARAQTLRHAATDQVSLADATRLIELNLARLKVAQLKRRRRPQN